MTGWIILIVILAVLFLIFQIRLGGRATFGPEGLGVVLMVGPARIKLLPSEPKAKPKKVKKEKKRKEKPAAAKGHEQQDEPGTVGRVMQLLPAVAETAGALKRRIRIDHLVLTVIWGAEDAASAAIGYGRANALLGMIWPLIDNNFKVKDCDFRVDVDYGRKVPEFTADAAVTLTVGQLLSFVFHYGIKLLMNWSRSGKSSAKQQEAKQ